MFALFVVACASLPTPTEVGGANPGTWVRASSSAGHWQASFPTWPEIHTQPQAAQLGSEEPANVVLNVVQSSSTFGTFAIASVPQTPGVLAQPDADKITAIAARDAARRVQGILGEIEPWEGVEGGVRAPIGVPGRSVSAVVAGLVDGVLVVAVGSAEGQAIVDAFLDGIHLAPEVDGVDVALTEGVRARCPAFCGPIEEQGMLGGVGVPLVGARGLVDHARFEVVVAPLRAGLDPAAAEEELRARFVSRVKGQLTDITPEVGGTRVQYTANGAVGVVQTSVVGGEVIGAEVWSGVGGAPDWTESFFGSIAAR
jgi:hypothetical protein